MWKLSNLVGNASQEPRQNNYKHLFVDIMKKKKPIKRTKPGDKIKAAKRRTEILKLIIEAGHPRAISQLSLAKHYKVSQVAICKDIQAISREIKESMPKDAEFITHVVMESAIKALSKSPDPDQKFKAAKLIMDWNNYLFEMGKQRRAPQRHEVKGEILNKITINIAKPEPNKFDDKNIINITKEK